jgi:hypothetical protein
VELEGDRWGMPVEEEVIDQPLNCVVHRRPSVRCSNGRKARLVHKLMIEKAA